MRTGRIVPNAASRLGHAGAISPSQSYFCGYEPARGFRDLIEAKQQHGVDEAEHEPDRHHRDVCLGLSFHLRLVFSRGQFAQLRRHDQPHLDGSRCTIISGRSENSDAGYTAGAALAAHQPIAAFKKARALEWSQAEKLGRSGFDANRGIFAHDFGYNPQGRPRTKGNS